jgi:hypothetical protein
MQRAKLSQQKAITGHNSCKKGRIKISLPGAHLHMISNKCMKFREDRTRIRQTDRRTDKRGDSSIPPPNFVAGGITKI